MRNLAAVLPLLLTLASAQETVIQSDNSRRTINHWSASAAPRAKVLRQAAGESRNFHWAAFSGIVGPALAQDMRDHGIEILGLAGRPGTLKLYKVHVPGDAAAALAYLKAVTGFVNLLPILREEKLSRGLLHASGTARKATIFFHRNLPYPEMEALLQDRVDAIHGDQDSRLLHVTASPARLRALADLEEVAQVSEEIKKLPVNYQSRVLTKVDALQAGTVDLATFPPTPEWNRGVAYTGDSIHVGVNEGFDINHRDFNEQLPDGALKPRASHGAGSIYPESHGSHVAGIIGGNGWLSELNDMDGQSGSDARYLHRGVAPKALFSTWGDRGDVNNHSFTNGDDAIYNGSDAYVDDRLSQHISLQESWNNVAVWSAANNGGSWAQYGNQRGFYSMLVNAKNPIKVGASNFQGIRTYFSSMGPTRDGRWGPDVVAPGEGIVSVAAGTNGYTWMSGTSMSGPHVTGITALIMQKYRDAILRERAPMVNVHENPMWNSTVKAILIHTATDMVDLTGQSFDNNPDFASAGFPNQPTVYTAGPDWATGFGMVNAQKALQYVDEALFREDVVDAGATRTYAISVPAGLSNLRVTLAWDDPEYAGIADNSNAYVVKLVNDLDLEVAPPSGNPWLPWTLDHAPLHNDIVPSDGLDPITPAEILDSPAVRGRDGVNNVEVVDVPNPTPGIWTLRVRGQAVTVDQSPAAGLNQDFSLVSDLALPPVSAPANGPDLIVKRLIITPSIPGLGRPLSFKAEITNIGNTSTPSGTPFQVDLRAFNNAFSQSAPHTQALQPGQSVVVALDQPVPGGSGSVFYPVEYGGWHGVTAVVDAAGAIEEQSERNNTLSDGVNVPSLPEPWQSRDIGYSGPQTGGTNFSLSANPVNVWINAFGTDIYGNRDEFHFLYRPLTGDGEIVGQVLSVGGLHEWAKAGLMIREDLSPESRNAFVAVTQAHGTTFQQRSATGGATATGEVPSNGQDFLKLSRVGNQITGYRSVDGIDWIQVGTVTLALPTTVYVGFAVTSHDPFVMASSWMTLRGLTDGVTSAVRGRVLDENAKPLAGVSLAISGAGCGTAAATTDAGGWYALTGIAAGSTCTCG
ncbi:MAG TPA: S8 family serine peptidase [Fibrobacteria bacterium]|nr:S8 family serine peptidase [Fibrobacteria bacterium]